MHAGPTVLNFHGRGPFLLKKRSTPLGGPTGMLHNWTLLLVCPRELLMQGQRRRGAVRQSGWRGGGGGEQRGRRGVGLYNRLPYYCLWPSELPLSKAACHSSRSAPRLQIHAQLHTEDGKWSSEAKKKKRKKRRMAKKKSLTGEECSRSDAKAGGAQRRSHPVAVRHHSFRCVFFFFLSDSQFILRR